MPDFTLSPRDLATLAQVNEARRAAPLTEGDRSAAMELAPFVEETRRNERALEAIPFISAR